MKFLAVNMLNKKFVDRENIGEGVLIKTREQDLLMH
jgi:hypothetical protein